MSLERILVVDDEESVRGLVGALLERSGYSITLADGAEAALMRMQEGPAYDLVLSDIMMPGTDGLSLLQQICAEYAGTPVVMITAVQDVHVATNAFRSGAIDYLLKPFARAQLESVVTRAMEHGRLMKQNVAYRQNLEEMVSARTRRLRATMQDFERSYDITLEAMGDALDLRDEETEGHSKRVTAYTIELARKLGLDSDELKMIARGALLHDIGKIATPDAILLKPGKLNDEEMMIMREHCARGSEIVCKIPFLRGATDIVHSHHERFDGKGYPRGLSGEEIPLGARIFAIADTLDAMTSDRPYRKGASFAAAREEIARCAGGQFDPRIVVVFLQIPMESWSELRAEIGRLSPAMLSAKLCRPAVARTGGGRLASQTQEVNMRAMTDAEINAILLAEPGWRLADGKLVRDWTFADFVKAMAFVNRVGALAEEAGHHPDIDIRYNRVRLGLVSHDAGGITERDARMAARISKEFGATPDQSAAEG